MANSPEIHSPSGIKVEPVYRPSDARQDYEKELGDPGRYPYARGIQPTELHMRTPLYIGSKAEVELAHETLRAPAAVMA